MPTCSICQNPIPSGKGLKATCGAEPCRRAHKLKISNQSRARKRAELGPEYRRREKPRGSSIQGFALNYCPFSTGAVQLEGRQPDFEIGF